MSEKTGIQWCDHTFNIAWGCTKVSAGCANCYADAQAHRYSLDVWGPGTERRVFGEKYWSEPLKWNRDAEKEGRRHRVFCSSMCDVFEEHSTITRERFKLWDLIAETPWLDWQVLTKRAKVMQTVMPKEIARPNLWLGVSVEDQKTADERIPLLLRTPAAARFVSYEPALGPVDFKPWVQVMTQHHLCLSVSGALRNRSFDGLCANDGRALSRREAEAELRALDVQGVKVIPATNCNDFDPQKGCRGHRQPRLDWIIVGGESGPGARPFEVRWARSVVDECRSRGVACFVKQLGGNVIARHVYDLGPDDYRAWDIEHANEPFPLEGVRVRLKDRKGGDMAEWPEDLRVREFPRTAEEVAKEGE